MIKTNVLVKRVHLLTPHLALAHTGVQWRALDHQCLSHQQIFKRRVTELEMHSSRLGENSLTT